MTARTARKTTAAAAPSVLDGVSAPAPTAVRRRRPSAKSLEAIANGTVAQKNAENAPKRRRPVATAATQSDALTSVAAPTTIGVDGSLIRHTQDYTVDLLDPGTEPERDYGKVLAKSPSETHLDFVAWVEKYVGYKADPKTVQILISTYHEFQKTPEQKAKTIAKRVAAAQKRADAVARKTAKTAAAK